MWKKEHFYVESKRNKIEIYRIHNEERGLRELDIRGIYWRQEGQSES